MAAYLPPVDRLLALGAEPARRRTWPDYRALGLEPRHVPALIRMAADAELHSAPEASREVWAPLHAWRALGQLEGAEAVAPLLALLEREIENGWVYEEIPAVLGMIGAPALHPATLILFDETRDERLREAAGTVLRDVGMQYPERRGEAVATLTRQLEDWKIQSPALNALLVACLIDLAATEAAPVMEAAFAAKAVDLSVAGDWEDVQVELGLLHERVTEPVYAPFGLASARTPPANAHAKAKSRRKAEKKSRKQNRKKK